MTDQLERRSWLLWLHRCLPWVQKKNPRTISVDTAEQQGHYDHVPILKLPNELILVIASFMDQESQVLLSLSCRRLRTLLDFHFDLMLDDDKATKIRFLQVLELDHPEYLTCRACGLMYLWRKQKSSQYDCPRENRHSTTDTLRSYYHSIHAIENKKIRVSRGAVDLILRAYEYGPGYGLPASVLNISRVNYYYGISRTHEARLVGGRLMLASRMEVKAKSGREEKVMVRLLIPNVCRHLIPTFGIVDEIWMTFREVMRSRIVVGWEKTEVFKCFFCETDHRLYVHKSEGRPTTMVLDVWRNYGQRHGNRLSNEQIFHRDPLMHLNPDRVAQRDLRAAFESTTA